MSVDLKVANSQCRCSKCSLAAQKPSSTHLGSLVVLLCCCLRLWPAFVDASDITVTVSSARSSAGRVPGHAASGKTSSSIGDAPSSSTSMASSASRACSACRQTQCCTGLHKQCHQSYDWCLSHDNAGRHTSIPRRLKHTYTEKTQAATAWLTSSWSCPLLTVSETSGSSISSLLSFSNSTTSHLKPAYHASRIEGARALHKHGLPLAAANRLPLICFFTVSSLACMT